MIKVRQEVFDTYWRFAAARQNIFFHRVQNDPLPWTDDPILTNYKFCNTYRASDRASQYLIRHVIYRGNPQEEDIIFRVLLFRLFNKIETWQYLESHLGDIYLKQFDTEIFGQLLQQELDAGHKIYSNAYILCANKVFGYDRKHLNQLALLRHIMLEDHFLTKVLAAKNLQQIFQNLLVYPLLGNFMAYQLTVDLNYSEVINFSENDFTMAGPGAERGISKCFESTGDLSNTDIIRWMTDHQEEEFQRLGIEFQSLWGRPLHLIDCQGLFCEVDKYSRVAFPELKSNRKRIKTSFQPSYQSIDYFYPPKWKINDKVNATLLTRREDDTRVVLQNQTSPVANQISFGFSM
jgi:5-hmdU DNA kinase, helical domain